LNAPPVERRKAWVQTVKVWKENTRGTKRREGT